LVRKKFDIKNGPLILSPERVIEMKIISIFKAIIDLYPGRFWEAESITGFWSKWNPYFHELLLSLFIWIRRRVGSKSATIPAVIGIFALVGVYHDAFLLITGDHIVVTYTIFFLLIGSLQVSYEINNAIFK